MKRPYIIIAVITLLAIGFFAFSNLSVQQEGKMENTTANSENSLKITPISHASMVLVFFDQVIYNDPVGVEEFKGQSPPDLILISDIHGDHLDLDTLNSVTKDDTVIIVPQAVKAELPKELPGTVVVLANGEKTIQKEIGIEAVAMYNLPESSDTYHTKGRGNGYVLSAGGKRVYIAGDTSVTSEMKALSGIDVAFIPMNLPYTMDVEEAAEGVLAFKPKVVHPYHYRSENGLSDVEAFKELVEKGDPNIKVEILNFYPEQ